MLQACVSSKLAVFEQHRFAATFVDVIFDISASCREHACCACLLPFCLVVLEASGLQREPVIHLCVL